MVDAFVGLEQVKKNGWAAAANENVKLITGRDPITFDKFIAAVGDTFRQRRIAVLGATGNTGKEVVDALKKAGAVVIAGTRDEKKFDDLKKMGALPVKFDFQDPKTFEAALKEVDGVYLALPLNPKEADLTKALLKTAKECKVPFFVRLSAMGADATKGGFEMAKWHGKADDVLRQSGIPWVILQPNFFMSNIFNQKDAVQKTGNMYGVSGTTCKTSYVAVADIAAVAVECLMNPDKHASHSYPLTGPQALTEGDIAEKLGKARGTPVKYVEQDQKSFKDALVAAKYPDWLVQGVTDLEHAKKQGWCGAITFHVPELTGRAATSFDTYVATVARAFVATPPAAAPAPAPAAAAPATTTAAPATATPAAAAKSS